MALFGLLDTGERAAQDQANQAWKDYYGKQQGYEGMLGQQRNLIQNQMGQGAYSPQEWSTMLQGMGDVNRMQGAQAQSGIAARANQAGLLGSGMYQNLAANAANQNAAGFGRQLSQAYAQRNAADRANRQYYMSQLGANTGQYGNLAGQALQNAIMRQNLATQMQSNDPLGAMVAGGIGTFLGGGGGAGFMDLFMKKHGGSGGGGNLANPYPSYTPYGDIASLNQMG